MRKLRAWLEERGLGRIAEILIQHDIDLDILPDLSDGDLEEAGLSLGERKRLRKAIGALRAEGHRPAAVPREQPPSGQRSRPEAERRQVTILFCDLVGSSTLAEQLDPEDMGEVLRSYRQLCAQVVERHGGTLVRYIGDGVLACLGYPVAHENVGTNSVRFASARSELARAAAASHGRRSVACPGRSRTTPYLYHPSCAMCTVSSVTNPTLAGPGIDLVALFADAAP